MLLSLFIQLSPLPSQPGLLHTDIALVILTQVLWVSSHVFEQDQKSLDAVEGKTQRMHITEKLAVGVVICLKMLGLKHNKAMILDLCND